MWIAAILDPELDHQNPSYNEEKNLTKEQAKAITAYREALELSPGDLSHATIQTIEHTDNRRGVYIHPENQKEYIQEETVLNIQVNQDQDKVIQFKYTIKTTIPAINEENPNLLKEDEELSQNLKNPNFLEEGQRVAKAINQSLQSHNVLQNIDSPRTNLVFKAFKQNIISSCFPALQGPVNKTASEILRNIENNVLEKEGGVWKISTKINEKNQQQNKNFVTIKKGQTESTRFSEDHLSTVEKTTEAFNTALSDLKKNLNAKRLHIPSTKKVDLGRQQLQINQILLEQLKTIQVDSENVKQLKEILEEETHVLEDQLKKFIIKPAEKKSVQLQKIESAFKKKIPTKNEKRNPPNKTFREEIYQESSQFKNLTTDFRESTKKFFKEGTDIKNPRQVAAKFIALRELRSGNSKKGLRDQKFFLGTLKKQIDKDQKKFNRAEDYNSPEKDRLEKNIEARKALLNNIYNISTPEEQKFIETIFGKKMLRPDLKRVNPLEHPKFNPKTPLGKKLKELYALENQLNNTTLFESPTSGIQYKFCQTIFKEMLLYNTNKTEIENSVESSIEKIKELLDPNFEFKVENSSFGNKFQKFTSNPQPFTAKLYTYLQEKKELSTLELLLLIDFMNRSSDKTTLKSHLKTTICSQISEMSKFEKRVLANAIKSARTEGGYDFTEISKILQDSINDGKLSYEHRGKAPDKKLYGVETSERVKGIDEAKVYAEKQIEELQDQIKAHNADLEETNKKLLVNSQKSNTASIERLEKISKELENLKYRKKIKEKDLANIKLFKEKNHNRDRADANHYRQILKADDQQSFSEAANNMISAAINLRSQKIDTTEAYYPSSVPTKEFARIGVIMDPRNGFTNLQELKKLQGKEKEIEDKIKQLKKMQSKPFTKPKVIDSLNYAIDQLNKLKNSEKAEKVITDRREFLTTQMVTLITAQLEKNKEKITRDEPFTLIHQGLLNHTTEKIDPTGWAHYEANHILDMKEIFTEFEETQLVFDGKGPYLSEDKNGKKQLHLPPFKEDHLQGVSVKLNPIFLNTTPQVHTRNDGIQREINKEALKKLEETVPAGEFAMLQQLIGPEDDTKLINRFKKRLGIDGKPSNYTTAEEVMSILLDATTGGNLALSIGCLSAKDRTGVVAAKVCMREVQQAAETLGASKEEKQYLNRSVLSEDGIAAQIVNDTSGAAFLKVDPRNIRNIKDIPTTQKIENTWKAAKGTVQGANPNFKVQPFHKKFKVSTDIQKEKSSNKRGKGVNIALNNIAKVFNAINFLKT